MPMKKFTFLFLLFPLLLSHRPVAAQSPADTLIMDNGNVLVGEMKEMTHGVLQMKTKYSDSDLKLKWSHVK
jgi:hypothetical protein